MVAKPGKVLCYMFLLAILGIDPAENHNPLSLCLTKIQKVVLCVNTTIQYKQHCHCVIHAWSMDVKQNLCRVKELLTKSYPVWLCLACIV